MRTTGSKGLLHRNWTRKWIRNSFLKIQTHKGHNMLPDQQKSETCIILFEHQRPLKWLQKDQKMTGCQYRKTALNLNFCTCALPRVSPTHLLMEIRFKLMRVVGTNCPSSQSMVPTGILRTVLSVVTVNQVENMDQIFTWCSSVTTQ